MEPISLMEPKLARYDTTFLHAVQYDLFRHGFYGVGTALIHSYVCVHNVYDTNYYNIAHL